MQENLKLNLSDVIDLTLSLMGGGEKGKSKIAPGRKSDQSRMGTFYGRTISFNSQINYMNIKGRSDCSKLRDFGNVVIKCPMCGPVYFLFQINLQRYF